MSTKIEWTDETWNPVTGCAKVSQGCKNCYAERLAPKVFAGQVIRGASSYGPEQRPRVFTDVVLHHDRLHAPLHWVKGKRVFVNSMSDLFHEEVPFQFIADVFAVMACTTRHQYQVLTKRPQRMLEFFNWLEMEEFFDWPRQVEPTQVWPQWIPHRANRGGYDNCGPNWPCENVWLGVSVEDQATADERIPLLLQTPAAVRFLSCEPLLGPIDLRAHLAVRRWRAKSSWLDEEWYDEETGSGGGIPTRLHWVIAGGESGPNARPSHPDWFRSLRDQCAAADVPYFFKQWGEWGPCETEVHADERGREVCPLEEPVMEAVYDLDSRRSFKVIEEHGIEFGRFGKKLNGRTLDGRTHDEYPA